MTTPSIIPDTKRAATPRFRLSVPCIRIRISTRQIG
jgi:hypothetical protein